MEKKNIRSSKSTNPVPKNRGSRCDSKSIKITPFQRVFSAVFVPAVFWKNASRGSWRSPPLLEKKHVQPEPHRGLGLWFGLLKRFPHHGIYTIHNCILSNDVESLWTSLIAIQPFWHLSLTLSHANSANHTVPRHTAPPILKNARKQKYCTVCSKKQKFLKQQKFYTQLSSQECTLFLHTQVYVNKIYIYMYLYMSICKHVKT